jgi:prevent-host-death family protein
VATKLIPSTDAQNNFGRILDDVVQNDTRYIVQRRNNPQAIILSLPDLESLLLASKSERRKLRAAIRELSPSYALGAAVEDS